MTMWFCFGCATFLVPGMKFLGENTWFDLHLSYPPMVVFGHCYLVKHCMELPSTLLIFSLTGSLRHYRCCYFPEGNVFKEPFHGLCIGRSVVDIVDGYCMFQILVFCFCFRFYFYFYNLVVCIQDRKSTRLNSSHITRSRMPSSA